VVTQSAMAFSTLVAACSLIVTQFQSISNFAAVVSRLSDLVEAVDKSGPAELSGVEAREEEGRFAYEALSLRSEKNGPLLIDKFSLNMSPGARVLIIAENAAAPLALFHATAGLDVVGEGRLVRPGARALQFLPERPYLAPGTLREALVPPGMEEAVSDQQLLDLLAHWELSRIPTRIGGLHVEQDWESELSLGEQQLLVCIRIVLAAPKFVVLDRPGTAMGIERITGVLTRFTEASIGYVQLGRTPGPDELYDVCVKIRGDGTWS
jgi:vitamin B12/bleomycin/antimicrobial peptide transport system ATP-binding/permease protein